MAFSLLEVVLVLFILGVLAGTLAPSVREGIESGRREAEARNLEEIAKTITASFDETDLTNLNVAALAGAIGGGDAPTSFSVATSGTYLTTATTDWFAKVARLRGITPQVGVAPRPDLQPELARLAFNSLGNCRWLFAGPTESGRQRFLLVSLMARTEQLNVPAYAGTTAWFDAIWNQDWESRTASLPALWTAQLSAAQVNAWTPGGGALSRTNRLVVRRLMLPKFRITVNNNHASEAAFVSFNNTPNAFTAAAASGANVSPEILGGRLIIINRGAAWPGTEALRFTLRENSTVTLQ
ncbi:MAG: type II secretion system protein [Candidatus Didemnitutus sp.]|nr:type II secretion system protein [Candidatus Didemnitutus sp.]